MLKYMIKRILFIIPSVLIVSILTFTVLSLSPGTPGQAARSSSGDALPRGSAVHKLAALEAGPQNPRPEVSFVELRGAVGGQGEVAGKVPGEVALPFVEQSLPRAGHEEGFVAGRSAAASFGRGPQALDACGCLPHGAALPIPRRELRPRRVQESQRAAPLPQDSLLVSKHDTDSPDFFVADGAADGTEQSAFSRSKARLVGAHGGRTDVWGGSSRCGGRFRER